MPAHRLQLPADLAEVPFTRAAGVTHGLQPSSFRSLGVRRLAPGVFQARGDDEPVLRDVVSAHLATLDRSVTADGLTALQLHGVDLGPRAPIRLCAPTPLDVRRSGVRVRRVATMPPARGRVQTPVAAFAAAAADLPLVELVAAGDWLVRLRKTTPEALQTYAAGLTGRHSRTVRRAAELVSRRVDSPTESRLRMCLVLAGLPTPVCNVDIGDDTFFVACPDLAYLLYRLLLEYEGDHHRTDRRQWDRDIGRERQLRRLGYEMVRVTAQTMRRPRQLVADVYDLLVQRGYDGPPPAYSAVWRSAFEPRPSSGRSAGSSRA